MTELMIITPNVKKIPKIIIEIEFDYRCNVELPAETLEDAYRFICGLDTIRKYGGDDFINVDSIKDSHVAHHIDSYYMYDNMPLYDCASYSIYVLSDILSSYDRVEFVSINDNDEIAKALLDGGGK